MKLTPIINDKSKEQLKTNGKNLYHYLTGEKSRAAKTTGKSISEKITTIHPKREKSLGEGLLGLVIGAAEASTPMAPQPEKIEREAVQNKTPASWQLYHAVWALGAYRGAQSGIKGLLTMIKHPIDTAQGLYYAATHPRQTKDAILVDLQETYHEYKASNNLRKGEMISKFVGSFAGPGVLAKVSKVSAVAATRRFTPHLDSKNAKAVKSQDLQPALVEIDETKSVLNTGGRQLDSIQAWNKVEKQAIQFYEQIRNNPSNSDVSLISKNTGMPEFQIQRIKQHLFFEVHDSIYWNWAFCT